MGDIHVGSLEVVCQCPLPIGAELRLAKKARGQSARFVDAQERPLVLEEPAGADALEQALLQLANQNGVTCEGRVARVTAAGLATLELEVYLPSDAVARWRPCQAAAQLFQRLLPLRSARGDEGPRRSYLQTLKADAGCADEDDARPEAFSLHACFASLPPKDVALPPVRAALPAAAATSLALLPAEALARVVDFLDARALCAAAATCRALRALAAEAAPDLRLTLRPHQRAALRWMLRREGAPRPVAHPTLQLLPLPAPGAALRADTATGELHLAEGAPPAAPDFRGGMLCDEPGLGKTITALSLVLSTLGALPQAPAGAEVTWFGRSLGAYTLSEEEAAGGGRRGAEEAAQGRQRMTRGARKLAGMDLEEEELDDPRSPKRAKRPAKGQPGGSPRAVATPAQLPRASAAAASPASTQPASSGGGSGLDEAPRCELSDGEADEEFDGLQWLQCELCCKWRKLYHAGVPPGAPWCCYLHPDPLQRSCALPEEAALPDEDVTQLEGWVGPGQEAGSAANVAFFRDLLATHFRGKWRSMNSLAGCPTAVLWLAEQEPASLTGQFAIPRLGAEPHGYGLFFEELGFEPVPANPPHKRAPGGRAANHRPYLWPSALPAARADWLRWAPPAAHWLLRLDTEALCAALRQGPAPRRRRLFLSGATLVVVPPELVQHWRDQIAWHTAPGALRVAVYDSESSGNTTPGAASPQALAWDFDVVLTTLTVLSTRWNAADPVGCCPLAQVHWLRIVLDEGHALGSLAVTSRLQMASALRAGRRWLMTGTPALTAAGGELACVHPLLAFLREPALGAPGQRAWAAAVERPMAARAREGRWRLRAALARCMVRASKAALGGMPRLLRRAQVLRFSPSHAASYNALCDTVRFNLLTSDWLDPDHKESLLCARNSKWSAQMSANVALSCNVAGNLRVRPAAGDVRECLELLAASAACAAGAAPPAPEGQGPPFFDPGHPLTHVEAALLRGGACQRCGDAVRVVFAAPCACVLCVDCTSRDREACARCATPYQMQAADDPARLEDNPNPKWAVPRQLIEAQVAFVQHGATGLDAGAWQPDWQATQSTKCDYLVARLRELGSLPRPLEPAAAAAAPAAPALAPRWQWASERSSIPKAIVFTQFWAHALLLRRALEGAGPPGAVALHRRGASPAEHWAELSRFRFSPACNVLLMDESGALGLDLSFASRVFLMEPLSSASLEEQVVARAHRMGASRDVVVEVVVMQGTLEEAMLRRQPRWWGGGAAMDGEAAAAEAPVAEAEARAGGGGDVERKRLEAGRRAERNALLLSLRPVKERGAADVCMGS